MKTSYDYLTAARQYPPARFARGMILVLFLLLTGCGAYQPSLQPGQSPPPEETQTLRPAVPTRTPRSTSTPAPPAPTLGITVLPGSLNGQVVQFWHPFAGEAQVLLDLMIQEFNRTNPWGVRVEGVSFSGFNNLQVSLRQALETGTMPEVWTASTYQALQLDAGGTVVMDLRPFISDGEYGLPPADQQDFLAALWDQERIPAPALKGRADPQGKHLGLPWFRNGILFWVNRTWAQELGFSGLPESPTGFRDQACAATRFNAADRDRTNDGTGGWMVAGEPSEMSGWLYAFGAEIVRNDGRGYQFDTPAARQAADFLAQLAGWGCLWKKDETNLIDVLAKRRALFIVIHLADSGELREALERTETEDRWEVMPFPSPVDQPAVVSHGLSLYLTRSTPEQELAGWLFIRWLTLPQNQAHWVQFNYLLPSRKSALEWVQASDLQNPDWKAALEYLPYLRAEPYYVSWERVRWSLSDAFNQLIASGGQPEQAVEILQMLDELAAEVHFQIR